MNRAGTPSPSILVVDAAGERRERLASMLLRNGFAVILASAVDEAIWQVRHEPPTAVVLRWPAAGGDSWPLIHEMAREDLMHIPLIFFGVQPEADEDGMAEQVMLPRAALELFRSALPN